VDLFVHADLARLGLPRGGRFLALAKSNYNRNVNDAAGALSDPVDDADFDAAIYIDQLWYEHDFLGGLLRARIGYLDMQVDFDRNAFANSEDRQFQNSFLDNSPIVPLEVGLGGVLVVAPATWLDLALGVADADNPIRQAGFDTAFDGADSWTSYAELMLHGGLGEDRPGSLRAGIFRDGASRPVFGRGRSRRGHLGAYLSADQRLWTEPGRDGEGLGLFARWGIADGSVNASDGFWSAGLQYDGPLPGRGRDALGLAVYQTLPGDTYRERVNADFGHETGVELYYRVELTPWLALTPDLQWIHDPGGSDAASDAFALILRLRVAL
jgi:porin